MLYRKLSSQYSPSEIYGKHINVLFLPNEQGTGNEHESTVSNFRAKQ